MILHVSVALCTVDGNPTHDRNNPILFLTLVRIEQNLES
jgi:hypothetical protein